MDVALPHMSSVKNTADCVDYLSAISVEGRIFEQGLRVPDFIPRSDLDCLTWSTGYVQQIATDPARFGIQPEYVAELVSTQAAFAAAMALTSAPGTRTSVAVVGKNAARAAMVDLIRRTAGQIRANFWGRHAHAEQPGAVGRAGAERIAASDRPADLAADRDRDRRAGIGRVGSSAQRRRPEPPGHEPRHLERHGVRLRRQRPARFDRRLADTPRQFADGHDAGLRLGPSRRHAGVGLCPLGQRPRPGGAAEHAGARVSG